MFIGIFFLFLLLTSITVASINPIGSIEIDLYFENPNSRLLNGAKCDTFHWSSNCDIFFIICITEKNSARHCNLYNGRTGTKRNTNSYNATIGVDYESNEEIILQINVMDHDHLSTADLIAEYNHVFKPSKINNDRMVPTQLFGESHPTMTMYVSMKKTCKRDHYGNECRFCSLPEIRGYCDANGIQRCHSDFFGSDCLQQDFCKRSNCASFAECKNMEGFFSCICDGTSGALCELGFDPCEEHACQHNGTCIAIGPNKNFAKCVNCDTGWIGPHCQEKMDLCVLEERRLGRSPCDNGGHCISRMNGTVLTCLCEAGWQGSRCNVYFSTASAVVAISVLFVLVSIIVALFFWFWASILAKLGLTKGRQRDVEMQQVKSDLNSELSRANNLYAEMGFRITDARTKPHETAHRRPSPINMYFDPFSTLPLSGINDGDGQEYEILSVDRNDPMSARCTPPSTLKLANEEGYEPISVKACCNDSTIRIHDFRSRNATNDEYGELAADSAIVEINRPPPSMRKPLPNNEDQYELIL